MSCLRWNIKCLWGPRIFYVLLQWMRSNCETTSSIQMKIYTTAAMKKNELTETITLKYDARKLVWRVTNDFLVFSFSWWIIGLTFRTLHPLVTSVQFSAFWFLLKQLHLLAFICSCLRFVCTVGKTPFEQLDSNNGKDELEQHVNNHDVEYVLERVDDTVKHGLKTDNRLLYWLVINFC